MQLQVAKIQVYMHTKTHWDTVYTTKAPEQVSWYRPHLDISLSWIERLTPNRTTAILDVGAGESTLVDDLIARGYVDISALDVSEEALYLVKSRLGQSAASIRWITDDVCTAPLSADRYGIWHDRAVFHFLTQPEQQTAYVAQAVKTIKQGGYIVIATFGPDGPMKCSGLEIVRYDAHSLQDRFGDNFVLEESCMETHTTPSGSTQQFIYCALKKN